MSMEKVEIGEPERLLKEIDFSSIVPDEKRALRIGSKVYILALGMIKDEFYLSNIKGDLEGIDKTPVQLRNEINVYSETELENIKRSFLTSGYLKQEEGSSAYRITDLGEFLFRTYIKLFRCHQLSKKIEHLEIEKNLSALESLETTREDTSSLPEDMKEEIIEKMRKGEKHDEQFVPIAHYEESHSKGLIKKNTALFINEFYDVKENIEILKTCAKQRPQMSYEEIDELELLVEKISNQDFKLETQDIKFEDADNSTDVEDFVENAKAEIEEKISDLNS